MSEAPLRIALIDYGAGNLHSLAKALTRAGATPFSTTDWNEALVSDAIVLPGVGGFAAVVEALPEDRATIRHHLQAGLPCLGICLGMQVLFSESEEAEGAGIGVIPGRVRRLRASRVPHIGWNDVMPTEDPDAVVGSPEAPMYFANSYVCEPTAMDTVVAWTYADDDRFASAVRSGNTWGVQFHPEKSSAAGLALIQRFVDYVRRVSS